MHSPLLANQFAFSLGELTYIDASFDNDAVPPLLEAKRHKLASWIGLQFRRLAEWRQRCAVIREMAMMTDHELSDIGISRSDLARVFDPTIVAASHRRGRDYIAY